MGNPFSQEQINQMEIVRLQFPFDTSMYRLGSLCKRNHSYNETNFTLRRKKGYLCINCNNDKASAHSKTPSAKKQRSLYKKSERAKAFAKKYKQSDLAKAADARWRASKKCLQYQQVYQAKRRAHKRTVSFNDYDKDDILILFSRFDNMCAYCGESKPLTLDHFIPLSKGGVDSFENIIPACKTCNSSKGNRDAEVWFKNKPFFSPYKLTNIYNYLST